MSKHKVAAGNTDFSNPQTVKKILKKGIPKVKGMCACCGVGNPEATKEDIDDGYNITWVYRTTCCNSEVLDENGLDVGEWS